METTRELSVVPQQGMITRMGMINPTFIEDAVIVSERNRKRNIPILLNQTLQALHLKNWKRTVLYPALETTSLQSATRLLYTVLRRRQACFLQEKLSVIRKSESHIRF